MSRSGWIVPALTHGKDDQLLSEIGNIEIAYRRQFKTPLRTLSGDTVDPKGDFLYVYLGRRLITI